MTVKSTIKTRKIELPSFMH